ncbi:peptidase inhibitor family I36 protein [Streptomyces aidingensis]|uniref:Peptidase inhibitor family I36 n=1 Tax=Streptomyces aidingensis TaxID=910347 RepID=A0A1I1M9R8_9ACTN|nr:peptidase inhibitor family I36 protein [Streptomyces aidingensis]SFC82257.1 Peptidase inhibitor family I36 [Streptomyces aidingensis]
MSPRRHRVLFTLITTAGLGMTLLAGGPVATASQAAAPICGENEICFWEKNDFVGTPWRWSPANGYRDMPSHLHDNVGSFMANAPGCFIDWQPEERRTVAPGDYSRAYQADGKFGSRIDAVAPSC